MIMTTDNYFAIEAGTLDRDFDRAIDFKSIKKNMGEMELGESADRVERRHTEFVAFSDETQIISDGRGIRFNENYAGYHYDHDSLYIHSDRGHSVKMEHFSMDSAVSVTFDGYNIMKFKLGIQNQSNQFTYEEGVQFLGSNNNYDRIVSNYQHNENYRFSEYFDVDELDLTRSAATNFVDTRNGGLNGKVVNGGTGSTELLWDNKYSGDTKFVANGRDILNFGSTTIDDISSISFGANNQISFQMHNAKTITVEGNQLDNIVFSGQNVGVNYKEKTFYVKG